MGIGYEKDLGVSAHRFDALVWPSLRKALGGRADLISIEQMDQVELARELDCTAGIDAWVRYDGDLYGIACRMQETARPFDTFTVRKSRSTGAATEWEKRSKAIERDALYPHLTVQAYVTDNPPACLSLAVIRTRDLFGYIRQHLPTLVTRQAPDGNDFLVVPWRALMGTTRIQLYRP